MEVETVEENGNIDNDMKCRQEDVVDYVEGGGVSDICDNVTITVDQIVTDPDTYMEPEEPVKTLIDQEKGCPNSSEEETLNPASTEGTSAEKDEVSLHQNETDLLQENMVPHEEKQFLIQGKHVPNQAHGLLYQDEIILHHNTPSQHQDKPEPHQDNVIVYQDKSVALQDNVIVHQDKPVSHQDNVIVHQDKIILQDKIGLLQDTVVFLHDSGLTRHEGYGRSIELDHIQNTNLQSQDNGAECGAVRTKLTGGMQISQDSGTVTTDCPKQQQECSGCKKSIIDRFLLKAMDQYWHEDCLKCSCCDCRLGEVGSTLFAKANLLLCRRDYLRLFGTTGYCSACSKMIPAFEMVMRAKNNVYHLECFACQMCNHRFCVGDKFYLCDNKILCEYDYEERMVFANMTYNYNALSQIKRQTNSLSDDLSSGYGSPSPGSL